MRRGSALIFVCASALVTAAGSGAALRGGAAPVASALPPLDAGLIQGRLTAALHGDADAGRFAPQMNGVFTQQASAAAIASRNALAASSRHDVAASGTWRQYGVGPVLNNTSDYTPVDAIPTFTGRVADLAYDPATNRVWAAVGVSGVYESDDLGLHWRNLTDALPNTTAGAVGFSPSHGGTLFDATGDLDGGYVGLGVYRSTDAGAHWQRAAGIPDALMSTRVAVDPTNPEVVYVATSRGLWRSDDDGQSFANVRLPVGHTYLDGSGPDCAGDTTHAECEFASVVTDVVVRSGDAKDKGGEVLAAVGWERGYHATAKGWYNALGNGIYLSATGVPGSFVDQMASAHGFTSPQSHIGRIGLGNAIGAAQNHDVVWAMVQDAQEENGQLPLIDPLPSAVPAPCALAPCYTTNLDNIYLSNDFGKTWTKKLPPAQTLGVSCAVTSTDQCYLLAAPVVGNYSPGVQARYNNYIRPDPTVSDANGNPTRILFGLEEMWEINLNDALNQQPTGLVVPRTIGRYFGNGFCPATQIPVAGVPSINPPVCPGQNDAPTTTHPDQHRGIFIPDGKGGVTFFAGNDGGVFSQHVAPGGDFANNAWGQGDNLDQQTLLSYDISVSGDGIVYSGLQDNGTMRIEPKTGREVEVFGGDGFFTATDPANSKVVYEEYTFGNMNGSIDGGHTWRSLNPVLTASQFSTPFAMDRSDAAHLMTGGEDIEETISGPNTTTSPAAQQTSGLQADGLPSPTSSTDWAVVFDLGSGNAVSAVDSRGDASYAGFCGPCYIPSTVASNFAGGIATNVGGSAPGKKMSKAGWHVAKAQGLPQRYITSVRIDPLDVRTVYVTLAAYDPTVEYRSPGALGDKAANLGRGHVFKSTDAGEHFTDISGNLPDTPAGWVIKRGDQLIVATNAGVCLSSDLKGTRWALLGGTSLPVAHVDTVELLPGNPNRLLASTYGRSIWVYDFPTAAQIPQSQVNGTPLPNTSAAPPSVPVAVLLSAGLLSAAWFTARRRRAPQPR